MPGPAGAGGILVTRGPDGASELTAGTMNSDKLAKKLIMAARVDAPSETVPYAFEKRILSRIQARPGLDLAGLWSRALWRAAIPCLAIPLMLGYWAVSSPMPLERKPASPRNSKTRCTLPSCSKSLTQTSGEYG